MKLKLRKLKRYIATVSGKDSNVFLSVTDKIDMQKVKKKESLNFHLGKLKDKSKLNRQCVERRNFKEKRLGIKEVSNTNYREKPQNQSWIFENK